LKVLAKEPQQMVLRIVISSATAKVEGTNMKGGTLQTHPRFKRSAREAAIMP
jgi:hypothetical protein